jgi:hypothetical protein
MDRIIVRLLFYVFYVYHALQHFSHGYFKDGRENVHGLSYEKLELIKIMLEHKEYPWSKKNSNNNNHNQCRGLERLKNTTRTYNKERQLLRFYTEDT